MKELITLKNILPTLSLTIVITFYKQGIFALILLLLLAGLILYQNKSKSELYLFISCGLFGATAEVMAIYFGAWEYANPNFIGIPIWLPVLWGIAAIFMNRLHKSLEKVLKK